MKRKFISALLTIIMLLTLIPAAPLTVSANSVSVAAPLWPNNEYVVGDVIYPSLKITGSGIKWTDFYTAKSTVAGCPKYGYYTEMNDPAARLRGITVTCYK